MNIKSKKSMSKSIAPKKKRGGPRKGAGRKPIETRKEKEAVTIYVEKEDVRRHGGKISLKDKLMNLVQGPINPSDPPTVGIIEREKPPKPQNKPNPLEMDYKTQIDNGGILKQIEVIKGEKIPRERDTFYGRKAWGLEQQKRIEELQKQIK